MALQSQQIIAIATQIAKVPGYTSQAGQLLNMILSELCETYDFDLAQANTTFSFNGSVGPYNMPADYLRAVVDDVFLTIQVGLPYFMVHAEKQEYDRFIQQPTLASYPTRYWVDMSKTPPQMWVWPQPSGAYPVNVSYYSQMPDIGSGLTAGTGWSAGTDPPEKSTTVPWFPCQSYLIQRLAGELMKISDDNRCGQFLGDSDGTDGQIEGCQSILRKYLMMKDDKDASVNNVRLDRRYFSTIYSALPQDKLVDWGGST